MVKLVSANLSDIGSKRKINEDTCFSSDELGLYLVADGMGGHLAGEVASKTAIEQITKFSKNFLEDEEITWPFGYKSKCSVDENFFLTTIRIANSAIFKLAESNPEFQGMGTTISGVRISSSKAVAANVGDSRIYLIRDNELLQISEDHSWVNEQMKLNLLTEEEARNHKWKNIITRALGNKNVVKIDLFKIDLQKDDMILICSDGLSSMVEDHEILDIILSNKEDLNKCCEQLIDTANNNGGNDNISVVLIKCLEI